MSVTVMQGDALTVLRTLPSESVNCCVTSPPYLGLRDYGTATWDGGDPACNHKASVAPRSERPMGKLHAGFATVDSQDDGARAYRSNCGKCGAHRIDQQIGLEATPGEYVARLVEVFREVRRVLHSSGTCWVVLGDSYAVDGGARSYGSADGVVGRGEAQGHQRIAPRGVKAKDLIGVPWMFAFAMRADGWWLRQHIVWSKKAPMPESVRDRCTRSHEDVFMITKAARYFYDAEAIAEPVSESSIARIGQSNFANKAGGDKDYGNGVNANRSARYALENFAARVVRGSATRNRRSVWTIGSEPLKDEHFAAFPSKLVEPMILAGTSERGCCAECGAPWRRVTERTAMVIRKSDSIEKLGEYGRTHTSGTMLEAPTSTTVGWEPTCAHDAEIRPCVVLDPFCGSGTTLRVAIRHNRDAIGIELNPEYVKLIERRIDGVQMGLTEAAS